MTLSGYYRWWQAFWIMACLAALTALLGCSSNSSISHQGQLVQTVDKLYQVYLDGNVEQAKQSLLKLIEVAQTDKSPVGQAHLLMLSYSRLYALEVRVGHPDVAEVYLVKARYWMLRRAELGGKSDQEAAESLKSFTGERCIEFIDRWDKDHTGGKGPKYVVAK